MKMFDMTRKDIEKLINNNESLKYLCCGYEIQCTNYKGPLYESAITASLYLDNYLDILKGQYYDKYKDIDEQDAAMIFISIAARIIAFYTHCWKMCEKIKSSNDFLFDNKNYQLTMFTLQHLANKCTMTFRILNKKTEFEILNISIYLKGNQELLKDIEVYSQNVKAQVNYMLDAETVMLQIEWRKEPGVSNQLSRTREYGAIELKTLKKSILDKID